MTPRISYLTLFLLLLVTICAPRAHAQPAPAATNNTPILAGSSDSGELERRLLFRARKALRESGDANADNLGAPNAYNWIILMQVARYSDSNVRLTNMNRGVQRFLEALVQSRQSETGGQVKDTVSILPYHFSLLGDRQVTAVASYLSDVSTLKRRVPDSPQNDNYQNQSWRDGHDWRNAMQQTLDWMPTVDLEPRHSIVIVLDWNGLAQAPITLANGTKPAQPATDADLVLPGNTKLYQAYSEAMIKSGFDPKKNLENVQVGTLEYNLAVFASKDLEPMGNAAKAPAPTAATPTPKAASGGGGGWILLPILALLGAAAFFLMRPVNFRLDESETRSVSALPAKTLPILGARTDASGAHFRVPNVNIDTDRPLAVFSTDFSKKLSVQNGALNARSIEGFEQTSNGLKLRGQTGELELVDSATNRVLTTISVRKL